MPAAKTSEASGARPARRPLLALLWPSLSLSHSTTHTHSTMTRVEITTSLGSFTLELYTGHAPKTCHNFVELARRGYYDGTIVRFCFAHTRGVRAVWEGRTAHVSVRARIPRDDGPVGHVFLFTKGEAGTRLGPRTRGGLTPPPPPPPVSLNLLLSLSRTWERRTALTRTPPLSLHLTTVSPHRARLLHPGRRPDGHRPGWRVRVGRQV